MKKGNGIWWIVGGLAVLGIGYFAFKKFSKKGEQKADEIKRQGQDLIIDQPADSKESPNMDSYWKRHNELLKKQSTTGNTWTNIGNAINNFLSNWNEYVVSTQSSQLNIREKPDVNSRKIGFLFKGETIYAKASGVKGWLAISIDATKIDGYVSQQYLKPKKKP